MFRLASFLLLFVIVIFSRVQGASAQISGIDPGDITPFWPGPHTYTPLFENSQYNTVRLKWEVKCTTPGSISSTYQLLVDTNNIGPQELTIPHYGPHRVRCTAIYDSIPGGDPVPPAPTWKELDINLVKPNKTEIIDGLLEPFDHTNTKKLMRFGIQYGDEAFHYVLGWPQEKIIITFPGNQTIDWIPATAAGLNDTQYTINGSDIIDYKEADLTEAQWAQYDVDEVFLHYTQQNRLVATDCTGATIYIPLSVHTIEYRKVGETEIQIEEVQDEE